MTDKKRHNSPFYSAEDEDRELAAQHSPNQPEYRLALADKNFLYRDEVRPLRIQMELMRPELVLNDHNIEETMVCFGSARIPEPEEAAARLKTAEEALSQDPNDPALQKAVERAKNVIENSAYLKEAERLAHLTSTQSDWTIVTGGGPSFMKAANRGAHSAGKPSIALGVVLPHEQVPNEFVTPELTFQFHYFAIRKMHFLMRAQALTAFPGGFGTMDELFETLTLIQTKKIKRIPLILFGKKFWDSVINFEALVDGGTINEKDLSLIQYVETADEAWQIIQDFYK